MSPSSESRASLHNSAKPMGGMAVAPCASCGCCCHGSRCSSKQDVQSLIAPVVESLRSDLQHFFISQLEEEVHPLKAEASIIRLWLARVANHLERAEPSCSDSPATDLVDLFGPCSPVQRSPTMLSFASLSADCTPAQDSKPHNEQYVAATASDVGQSTTKECELPSACETVLEPLLASGLHAQTPVTQSTTMDVATTPLHIVTPLELPTEQVIMLRACTSDMEVVMVEDASEDEEADSVIEMSFEDPVDLVIATDDFTQSSVEVKVERSDNPLMEIVFPMDDTTRKIEELQVVTPIGDVVLVEDASEDEEDPTGVTAIDAPTLSLDKTMTDEPQPPDDPLSLQMPITSRCKRRKSHEISSLRRSARIAQRNTLKRLGIIGNNGKIDEDVIQEYADYLKELLPPDVLNSLMHAKGRAFWDLVAGISLPPS
ncbi:unnamed protein product [Urochloa decumbens]|uniref:Uncharacterized protein n=1 Tax=Urochloa decumbens TaxID=240449 RepID=A0ABC9CUF7_9POAL